MGSRRKRRARANDRARLERQHAAALPRSDIVTVNPRFGKYVVFNSPIQRLYTGTLWAEGPAWNGVGRYMVWSDIPNNVQLRWIADDNRVTKFHDPSGYSNGNTFDREGRQLSCEHGGRRVARYEQNGTITAVAERFEGKRFNSPNDIVVHPGDGSIWFTDPTYGINGQLRRFPGYAGVEASCLSGGCTIGRGDEGDG